MLELTNNRLTFSFPEVHPDAKCVIHFHRTLRIPDDGRTYPLPAGLGTFPLRHVDDFKETVPDKWLGRGGVMLPMWQSEAMWLQFVPVTVPGYGHVSWPCAVKIAAGKVSAITGKGWKDGLRERDYCVAPGQRWLDGFVVEDGKIRQFVASPLGSGYLRVQRPFSFGKEPDGHRGPGRDGLAYRPERGRERRPRLLLRPA